MPDKRSVRCFFSAVTWASSLARREAFFWLDDTVACIKRSLTPQARCVAAVGVFSVFSLGASAFRSALTGVRPLGALGVAAAAASFRLDDDVWGPAAGSGFALPGVLSGAAEDDDV